MKLNNLLKAFGALWVFAFIVILGFLAVIIWAIITLVQHFAR